MANYTQLIKTINDNIKANGNQEITGPVLNAVLQAIVSGMSEGALFAGIATPTTNPPAYDGDVFYIATEPGAYSNFGGIEIESYGVYILENTGGTWSLKEVMPVDSELSAESLRPLQNKVVSESIARINEKFSLSESIVDDESSTKVVDYFERMSSTEPSFSTSVFSGFGFGIGEVSGSFRYLWTKVHTIDQPDKPATLISKVLVQIRQTDKNGSLLFSRSFNIVPIQSANTKDIYLDLGEDLSFTGELYLIIRFNSFASLVNANVTDNPTTTPGEYFVNGNMEEDAIGTTVIGNGTQNKMFFKLYSKLVMKSPNADLETQITDLKNKKQSKTDESLQTSDKTVAGAINEVNQVVKTKQDKLKAGTGVEITSDNTVNVTLDTTVFKVVASLPESPAAGDENKIHLVPAESTEEGNIYTEYVYVNGKWEEFGTYKSEVDLTPYLKKADAESTYQKITDNTLATTAKTVVGAINENTGNVTRIDRAVGNPVIEEVDLSVPDEPNFYWSNQGVKSSSINYGIKYASLSKGDVLVVNVGGVSTAQIITIVDASHSKRVSDTGINGYSTIATQAKYSYMASDNCVIAISYVQTGTVGKEAHIIKSPFNTAISDNSYMQYLHKVYEEYGAVYNKETGYWELNGLTDLTEEDMWDIYLAGVPRTENLTEFYKETSVDNKSIRTTFNFTVKGDGVGTGTILGGTFLNCGNVEVVQFYKNPNAIIYAKELFYAFYNCQKLREIVNTLQIYKTTALMDNAFVNCKALKSVKLKNLRKDISFKDSPFLSYESLNYLVTNATNTAAITVTVHPTTYSYLTGTAQPTEEVGGTTEEWQALVTTAQGKQISFAQPAEILEVEPLE